jgi:hypothetical protein
MLGIDDRATNGPQFKPRMGGLIVGRGVRRLWLIFGPCSEGPQRDLQARTELSHSDDALRAQPCRSFCRRASVLHLGTRKESMVIGTIRKSHGIIVMA